PDGAGGNSLDENVADDLAQPLLRGGHVLTLMHQRRELGPVLVPLVGDDREAFKYRLKSLANRARLITQLAEVLEVIGDMAVMPGDQDRLDTGEVLGECSASNDAFL